MVADPLSIAGLGTGAASFAIQLADGLRKGLIFIEKAAHAEADGKVFANRLAIERRRFALWSDQSGLSQAAEDERNDKSGDHAHQIRKARQDFEKFIKYSGPAIVPILVEMNKVLLQLSHAVNRYPEFIDAPADDDVIAADEAADTAEHPALASSLIRRVQSLGLSVRANRLLLPQQSHDETQSSNTEPKPPAPSVFNRLMKAGKKAANPKSLRWVIHDAEDCMTKITQVRQLNDFLHESLSHVTRDRQIEEQEMRLRDAVLLAVTDSRASAGGDNTLALSGSTAMEQTFRSGFIRQAARFFSDFRDQSSRNEIVVRVDAEEVSNLEYLGQLEGGLRQSVRLRDGRGGWVEWKRYTEVNLASKYEPPRMRLDPDIVVSMDSLVLRLKMQNKPREFCVPPCLGYFIDEDDTRIGMLYEPPAAAPVQTPRSLLSYLGKVEMSLSKRIRIAKTLAQWLSHLHSVQWLHKGIDSASVLFFSPDGKPSLENPYMTGFSYARPASTDPSKRTTYPSYEAPHVYYVHPDYQDSAQSGGYREEYDVYSLGIVLIELAYWQPIEDILRSSLNSSPVSSGATAGDDQTGTSALTPPVETYVNRVRPLSAEVEGRKFVGGQHPVLEHLRTLAGDKYYAAVKSCVHGVSALSLPDYSPESNTEVSSELLDAYYSRNVVEPLGSIAL